MDLHLEQQLLDILAELVVVIAEITEALVALVLEDILVLEELVHLKVALVLLTELVDLEEVLVVAVLEAQPKVAVEAEEA